MKTSKVTMALLGGAIIMQAAVLPAATTLPVRNIAANEPSYYYYNMNDDAAKDGVEYINYIYKLRQEDPYFKYTDQETLRQAGEDLIWRNQVDRAELRIYEKLFNISSHLNYEDVLDVLLMYKKDPLKLKPLANVDYGPVDTKAYGNSYVMGAKQRGVYDGADDYNEGTFQARKLNEMNNSIKHRLQFFMSKLFNRQVNNAEVEGFIEDVSVRNENPYFPKNVSVATAFGKLLKKAISDANIYRKMNPQGDLAASNNVKQTSNLIVKIMNKEYQKLPAVIPVSSTLVYLNAKKIEESFNKLGAEEKTSLKSDLIQQLAATLSKVSKDDKMSAVEEWQKLLSENVEKLPIEKSLTALSILKNIKPNAELTTEALRTFVTNKMMEISSRQMMASELIQAPEVIKGVSQIVRMTSNVQAYKCMKNY